MPRGRRPATHGVFAIEDVELILPSVLAFDTSFVVEVLIETQPLHPVCSGFVERLIEADVTIVTSDLLDVELAEAAFAIALKRRWQGRWRHHRGDGRARRPARSLLLEVTSRYETLLSSLAHIQVLWQP